jgi:hypothetical protein
MRSFQVFKCDENGNFSEFSALIEVEALSPYSVIPKLKRLGAIAKSFGYRGLRLHTRDDGLIEVQSVRRASRLCILQEVIKSEKSGV